MLDPCRQSSSLPLCPASKVQWQGDGDRILPGVRTQEQDRQQQPGDTGRLAGRGQGRLHKAGALGGALRQPVDEGPLGQVAGVFLLLGGFLDGEMPDSDFPVEHAACGGFRGWHPIRLAARAVGRNRHTSQELNRVYNLSLLLPPIP